MTFNKHTQRLHKRIQKMIKQMQADSKGLESDKIEWVNKIALTASEFESGGFSNRQCEVISDIYKSYKQVKVHKSKKQNNNNVVQGNFNNAQ